MPHEAPQDGSLSSNLPIFFGEKNFTYLGRVSHLWEGFGIVNFDIWEI